MINEGESGEVKNDEGLGAQAFSLSLSPPLVLRRVPRVVRELKQLGRTSTKTANEVLIFRFPFSCMHNSCVSFSFCLKVCGYENLEALFLKLHED